MHVKANFTDRSGTYLAYVLSLECSFRDLSIRGTNMSYNVISSISFLSIACFCGGIVSGDDSKRSIGVQIQGRWEIIAGVNQGRELPLSAVEGNYVAVKDNLFATFDSKENQRYKATFIVDDSTDPVQVKMTTVVQEVVNRVADGADGTATAIKVTTESVALGILRIDNPKKWTLCYALPGAERPTSFKSPAGSKVMLFTLEKK